MRECTAGDSKEAQKGCIFFERDRDGKCMNQRFSEFCPYYDTLTGKETTYADTCN